MFAGYEPYHMVYMYRLYMEFAGIYISGFKTEVYIHTVRGSANRDKNRARET